MGTTRTPRWPRPSLLPLAAALAAFGCSLPNERAEAGGGPTADERAAIEGTLEELYRAFCFEPGGEADWDGMRALFAPGATFFAPIRAGRTPAGESAEEFVAGFQDWVRSSPIGESGLHERITHWRIERCGTIAHAFVTFDGVIPVTEASYSQGVDAVGLVLDGDRWLVASFASQYARPDAPLPERFVDPRTARGPD